MAGNNVKNIFAGANHSFAVLDSENPKIENYSIPSPTKSNDVSSIMIDPNQHNNDNT